MRRLEGMLRFQSAVVPGVDDRIIDIAAYRDQLTWLPA